LQTSGTANIELSYLGRTWHIGGAASSFFAPAARRAAEVSAHFRGSLSALGTALIRAAHGRLEPRPLIDDPWGDRLVPQEVRAAYLESALSRLDATELAQSTAAPDKVLDSFLGATRAYANVILRTRYTEDALREAIDRGVRQYVIIGAGFDSFALRRPAFADGVSVFEIDQPGTQELKRRRIAQCGIPIPPWLHFVAADLADEDLAAVLARADYRADEPAFFSWLGVTMFLTGAANVATLQAIARCSALGSELVFTYLDERIMRSPSASFLELRESNRLAGEPFLSAFDAEVLDEDLRKVGWNLLRDLSDVQLARQFAPSSEQMRALEFSRIAHARVAAARDGVTLGR
jgi:methyltransferase (TIGR00027 family)